MEQGHAAAAAEARLHRQVHVGGVTAHLRQAHRYARLLRHRRRPVRPPVVYRQGRHRRLRLRQGHRALAADGAAALAQHAGDGAGVEGAGEVERDRARPRPHLPPGLCGADRAAQPGAGDEGGTGRSHQELEQVQGARERRQLRLPRGRPRRALPSHGDPRGQDRELPALSSDALEREPARFVRNTGPVRGRRPEHPHIRGERTGELQGNRHHAGRALVRPVPALWRAHVWRRQDAQGRPHAHGDGVGAGTMAVTAATEGPEQLVERVQDLQLRLAAVGDVATQQLAEELVSAIVQMYGAGLEQILDVLFAAEEEGARLAMTMADDPLVATLFMIHDLHPVPLADRVDRALEHVRPYMESHGGNVELLSLQDGVARLRLEGSCSDCSASAVTLELAIKQALEQAAPDLDGLEVEGVLEAAPAGGNGAAEATIPDPAGSPSPVWIAVDRLDVLPAGALIGAEI